MSHPVFLRYQASRLLTAAVQSSLHMSEDYLNMNRRELDCHFQVHGRFYTARGAGATYACRDLLEIRSFNAGSGIECDAVFVMMNPGSSKPLEQGSPAAPWDAALAPTKPDTTQYQLMRLMGVLGWNRVRVLNLSDLRASRSQDFFELVKSFEDLEGHGGHSIFSSTRQSELVSALVRKAGGPIVAAWGVDPTLKQLATNALQALQGDSILGLAHDNGEWAYRHPLPQTAPAQELWRRNALEMIQAKRPARGA